MERQRQTVNRWRLGGGRQRWRETGEGKRRELNTEGETEMDRQRWTCRQKA